MKILTTKAFRDCSEAEENEIRLQQTKLLQHIGNYKSDALICRKRVDLKEKNENYSYIKDIGNSIYDLIDCSDNKNGFDLFIKNNMLTIYHYGQLYTQNNNEKQEERLMEEEVYIILLPKSFSQKINESLDVLPSFNGAAFINEECHKAFKQAKNTLLSNEENVALLKNMKEISNTFYPSLASKIYKANEAQKESEKNDEVKNQNIEEMKK